jgi:hypothetical protein
VLRAFFQQRYIRVANESGGPQWLTQYEDLIKLTG